jgi:hypothetical protein
MAALAAGVALLASATLLAGCGAPPDLDDPAGPTAPPPSGSASGLPPLPSGAPGLPVTPSAGFGDTVAVSCAGQPDQAELLDLLRAEGLLGADADAQVVTGPLCAGDWQYTVVTVPDLDPLQVVTQGEAGALQLVTAGTDVCTPEVRVQAPGGIRDLAACLS